MQLNALAISGIKGFADRQRLDFERANLIYGANSSGKSSILQTLLLLQQSSFRAFSAERGFLEFRGSAVDLGGFRTFVNMHDTRRPIDIALTVSDVHARSPISLGDRLTLELRFEMPDDESADPDLTRIALVTDRETVAFSRSADKKLRLADSASGASIVDGYFAYLSSLDQRTRRNAMPTPDESARRWLRDWLKNQVCDTTGWLAYWPVTTVTGRPGRPVGGSKGSSRNQLAETLVVWWMNYIFDLSYEIYNLLTDIVYVGPLREFPRRVVTEASEESGVGARGERLVLHLARHDGLVTSVNAAFEDLDIPYELAVDKVRAGRIEDALGDVAVAVLTDRRSGVVVSPADVGFGLSQVLPVVVQLVGNTDKTILIEQPEIHLHPKMQAKLADVILKSIRDNRNQVIIETHSEHILVRFERRLRQTPPESRRGTLAVFYVGSSDGAANVQRLRVADSGRVVDPWPDGFFDDKLEDLMN